MRVYFTNKIITAKGRPLSRSIRKQKSKKDKEKRGFSSKTFFALFDFAVKYS
jgi:hypothetical protein